MALITKMRIHRFGGREVLQADDVEPSLPDAVDGTLPGAADFRDRLKHLRMFFTFRSHHRCPRADRQPRQGNLRSRRDIDGRCRRVELRRRRPLAGPVLPLLQRQDEKAFRSFGRFDGRVPPRPAYPLDDL
jgi:hypothetical protein